MAVAIASELSLLYVSERMYALPSTVALPRSFAITSELTTLTVTLAPTAVFCPAAKLLAFVSVFPVCCASIYIEANSSAEG